MSTDKEGERARRRHVRLRPMAELPLRAVLKRDGKRVDLSVADVSVTGVAYVLDDALVEAQVGMALAVELDLGRYGKLDLRCDVRHIGRDEPDTVGTEFVGVTAEDSRALGRYVAELLERGALS